MSRITKQALKDSMNKLLQKKPIKKITIADITRDCGISRMAFYYHFQDIYALFEWACIDDISAVLGEKKTYETWQQGFLQIFQALLTNKDFILRVYSFVDHGHLFSYLHNIAFELLMGVIEELSVGMVVPDEDKKFIADFYKFAFVGLIMDWVSNRMLEDPQQIISRLGIVIDRKSVV